MALLVGLPLEERLPEEKQGVMKTGAGVVGVAPTGAGVAAGASVIGIIPGTDDAHPHNSATIPGTKGHWSIGIMPLYPAS
jgi:hypothetical protein